MMDQQYIPRLTEAYRRGYEKKYAGAKDAPEMKLHNFKVKEYLRHHQPFVWNATDITTQMRESLISLFETYRARVRIVYLETDWDNLQVRNSSREDAVPLKAIDNMLSKLTLPEAFEARMVEWINV